MDLPTRLHEITSRMSREGGWADEQATIAEAAAVIVERQNEPVSEADARITAELLLEFRGEKDAWEFLTNRALEMHLAQDWRGRDAVRGVLKALSLLTRDKHLH